MHITRKHIAFISAEHRNSSGVAGQIFCVAGTEDHLEEGTPAPKMAVAGRAHATDASALYKIYNKGAVDAAVYNLQANRRSDIKRMPSQRHAIMQRTNPSPVLANPSMLFLAPPKG